MFSEKSRQTFYELYILEPLFLSHAQHAASKCTTPSQNYLNNPATPCVVAPLAHPFLHDSFFSTPPPCSLTTRDTLYLVLADIFKSSTVLRNAQSVR